MVLKNAKILAAGNVEIEIGLGSDFLVGKLDAPARNLLAEKFTEIFGRNLQIKISRAEIKIESAAPEISETQLSSKKKTLADAADNLFEEGW
jgi:hypothetical protein